MEKIRDSLFGDPSKFKFEHRIFHMYLAIGLCLNLLMLFFMWVLPYGKIMGFIILCISAIELLIYYRSYCKDSYKIGAYIDVLLRIVILYPSLWFLNGGSSGPATLFFMYNVITIPIVLSIYRHKLLSLVNVLSFSICMMLEYNQSIPIMGRHSGVENGAGIGLFLAVISFFIIVIMYSIMREYNRIHTFLKAENSELEDAHAKLQTLSTTDEVAGIFNRSYVMKKLKNEVDLVNKDRKLAVVIMDIDRFKNINDTYGHGFGDDVIRAVGTTMASHLRKSDSIGRIGGEEFLFVLPDTEAADAVLICEKIRGLISALDWEGKDIKVTLSAGVYCGVQNESAEEMLKFADNALYLSKHEGRDRVTVYKNAGRE